MIIINLVQIALASHLRGHGLCLAWYARDHVREIKFPFKCAPAIKILI